MWIRIGQAVPLIGRALLVKPTNKASSTGVLDLSTSCIAISLSAHLNRFYRAQQRLWSRRGLTRGVQGRAVKTEFLTVGKEDMGIRQREIITYSILIQYKKIEELFKEHHSASSINYNNLKPTDCIDIAGRNWITYITCHFNKPGSQHHKIFITIDKNWAIHIASYINLV